MAKQPEDKAKAAAAPTFAASKCDWVVQQPGLAASSSISDMVENVQVRLPGGSVGVSSSKCDWVLRSPGVNVSSSLPEVVENVQVRLPGGSVGVSSSKCDWVLRSPGVNVSSSLPEVVENVQVRLPGGSVGVSSSKRDWVVSAREPNDVGPLIDTRFASSKCDFSLTLEFGPALGRRYRVHAVGSAKCDFRIKGFDLRDPDEGWRAGNPEV